MLQYPNGLRHVTLDVLAAPWRENDVFRIFEVQHANYGINNKNDQRRWASHCFHGRRRLHHPHDDAIVITLAIANYTTRRVLIDNGSLADILYYPTFQQIRINRELLHPVNVPLIGFGGMKVLSVGTISLPVMVGSYPRQINKEVNFLVANCLSIYNAVIGWLTLNSWWVTTSTYHLLVKFTIEYGIG